MQTALHLACREDKLDEVKKLCKSGIDVNAQDDEGKTALHIAVLSMAYHVCIWILQNRYELKLNLHIKDNIGYAAYDYLRVVAKQDDAVRLQGGPSDTFISAIVYFSSSIKREFEKAFTLDSIANDTATNLQNHFACHKILDNLIAIQRKFQRSHGIQIVEHAKNNNMQGITSVPYWKSIINFQDDTGHTALYYCCLHQDWGNALFLLQNGASLSMRYAKQKYPLLVLVAMDNLNDAAIGFLKNIFDNKHVGSAAFDSGNGLTFIRMLASRHVIDARFVPNTTDSFEYFRFYQQLRKLQIFELRYLLSVSSIPLRSRFGGLKLIQSVLLTSQSELRKLYASDLQKYLPDVTDKQLDRIAELVSSIIPWRVQNVGSIKKQISDIQCFEIIYRDYNKHCMALGILHDGCFIFVREHGRKIVLDSYQIDNFEFYVDTLNGMFGKVFERARWFEFIESCSKKLQTEAREPSPLKRSRFDVDAKIAVASKYSLVYSAVAYMVLNNSVAVELLARAIISYHFHKINSEEPEDETICVERQTTDSYSLERMTDKERFDNIFTDLEQFLLQEHACILTPEAHEMSYRDSSVLEQLKFSLPYQVAEHRLANLLAFLANAKYYVMFDPDYYSKNQFFWLHKVPESASKLAGIVLGIPPQILNEPWLRVKHLAAFYYGFTIDTVKQLSDDKLLAITDGMDPVQALSLPKAHKSISSLEAFRNTNVLLESTIITGSSWSISLSSVFKLREASLADEELHELNFIQWLACSHLVLAFDEIRDAELSFEKLALLDYEMLHFSDIANQQAVARSAAQYGYSTYTTDWKELVCYILQITPEELNLQIYNEPSAVTSELNNLQRYGLIMGLSLQQVTAENFNQDSFSLYLFTSENVARYFAADPSFNADLSRFREVNEAILTPDRPFRRNAVIRTDIYRETVTKASDVLTDWPLAVTDVTMKDALDSTSIALENEISLQVHIARNPHLDPSNNLNFFNACKKSAWSDALFLLQHGADILSEFPNGASPLEHIAFAEVQTPEYVQLIRLIAEVLAKSSAYNLSFYSEYGFYYPFIGALAAGQPFWNDLQPNHNDTDAYKHLYCIVRIMQLKFMIHYQLELPPWYDSVAGIANKPTGSFGRTMQKEFLYYHRKLFADSKSFAWHFDNRVSNSEMPERCLKFIKRTTDSLARVHFIDQVLSEYLSTTPNNLVQLQDWLSDGVPVAFEVQIMMDFFAHNLNAYTNGDLLYIADRSRGEESIRVYQISNREKLSQEIKKIFGRRVEIEHLHAFEMSDCIELKMRLSMPRQTAFNCTFASMEALYTAIVLDTFLHDVDKLDYKERETISLVVRSWSLAVRNYGLYLTVQELQTLHVGSTCYIDLLESLPALSAVSALYNIDIKLFERLEERLYARFLQNADENAGHAGIDLNSLAKTYDDLDDTQRNFLYDLGPRAAQYIATCSTEQLSGINYGLPESVVKADDFKLSQARLLLFYPHDRIKKLSEHQVQALRNNVPFETVTQPWFREFHTFIVMHAEITDFEVLKHAKVHHVLGMQRKLIGSDAITKYPHFSTAHVRALERYRVKILANESLLKLPGAFTLGIVCGLNLEQMLDPRFSSDVAMAVSTGLPFEQACTLNYEQNLCVVMLDLTYDEVKTAELDRNKAMLLKTCKEVKLADIANNNVARVYALRNKYDHKLLLDPNFTWVHAVAHVLKVKVDGISDADMLLKHVFAHLYEKKVSENDSHYNVLNCIVRYMLPDAFSLDDPTEYTNDQLDCIICGLTPEEVRQPWYSAEHHNAAKWGMNLRLLVDLDAAAVKEKLRDFLQTAYTDKSFILGVEEAATPSIDLRM